MLVATPFKRDLAIQLHATGQRLRNIPNRVALRVHVAKKEHTKHIVASNTLEGKIAQGREDPLKKVSTPLSG